MLVCKGGTGMPTNEEGEFELVLGNRQLLSVFFLVVLLLGVFFSMGYIVGRTTAPTVPVANAKQQPTVIEPPIPSNSGFRPIVDPTKPNPSGPVIDPATTPPTQTAKPVEPVKPEPPKPTVTDPPAHKPEPPKPEPKKPETKQVTKAEPKPEPPKPPPPEPKPVVPVKPTGGGTYLQVSATRPLEADLLMKALLKKGYSVTTSPVENSPLVRVLVGPLDSAQIPKIRDELTEAGFKPFARKL